MHIVNQLKKLVNNSRLFVHKEKLEKAAGKKRSRKDNVKMGQGGTLDPLADGVLVVGVGKGTKRLNDFLDCTKVRVGDVHVLGGPEPMLSRSTARHVCWDVRRTHTIARARAYVQRRGDTSRAKNLRTRLYSSAARSSRLPQCMSHRLSPASPVSNPLTTSRRFSALKMDGMPLYDYARKGIPLPRPIEKRPVTVHSLELVDWKGSDHSYRWPENVFTAEQKKALARSLSGVKPESDDALEGDPSEAAVPEEVPTAFVLRMRVSGGTYVRSIVHDLAHALGSAGHVVTLTRSRQKDYALEPEEGDRRCVPWEVFEAALEDAGERDADGWTAWEREVLDKLVVVDGDTSKP